MWNSDFLSNRVCRNVGGLRLVRVDRRPTSLYERQAVGIGDRRPHDLAGSRLEAALVSSMRVDRSRKSIGSISPG